MKKLLRFIPALALAAALLTVTALACSPDDNNPEHHENVIQTDEKKPTCLQGGYYELKCTVCGWSRVFSIGDIVPHEFGPWEIVKEPTCTKAGEKRAYCSTCNKWYPELAPATGHSWYKYYTKEPTCTTAGEYYTYCRNCPASQGRSTEPATGHFWVVWKRVFATYNTSGFSGNEAIAKYLDIVKAEAAEANKAASANAEMKDFSVEISQFAKDDVKVKIMTKIPVSGWSFDDSGRCLVENDDPTAFGAGAIRFEVRTNVEDFDYYKDDFENYQDIDDRVIGGITFKGRTYKHIGYNWIQYVAQIDDGRALSIGLTKLECVPGTMPDIILNNMTFK